MTRKEKNGFSAEYLFAALFLIVAALVIGWQMNRSVVVTDISVTGHHMSEPAEIERASGVEHGMHADSIAYLQVIERVEMLPWVARAYVSLSPSGNMRIRVEEQEPMALLVDGRRSTLVTESGIQLPVVLGRAADVPILYGFDVSRGAKQDAMTPPDTIRSPQFETARAFLQQLGEYPGLYAMVSELMVTDEDGVVALSNENAVRLTFGHNDFKDRIRKWHAFQSQVISEKGIDQMRSLDFRYRGQVVALE
ncbi:MAG: FtsQ-type POTRA domain-containing protein [Cyclonatronaceae bacterium]